MMLSEIKKCRFADWLLLVSLVLTGGFFEHVSCVLSAAMCLYLLIRMGKTGKLLIAKDIWTSLAVAISVGYGLTCFWAVDRGMAVIGFFKFLPLLLYMICLRQEERTDAVLHVLPLWGAAMAVVSAIGMHLPVVDEIFSVSGRLAGFFQYPNTFAVFLLVCQLLVLKKEGKGIWDYVLMAVLLAAFLYTGSRTALIVAGLANVGMLLVMTGKKTRRILLLSMAAIALVVGLLALNEDSVLNRYLNISLTQSTFVGRILYWVDSLALVLRYPFGMGYMGYFYAQGSVQTGIYSVTYAHNDFLQVLLDVGFVPAGLLIGALIAWFFRKGIPAADKIIVGAVCLHTVFDFNLQYIAMFMLLLLLVSRHENKPDLKCKVTAFGKAVTVVVAVVSLYMSVPLLLSNFNLLPMADTLYPYDTRNLLIMLEDTEDLDEAEVLADRILRQNKQYFAPYTVKARRSYTEGDITQMIRYMKTIFRCKPFAYSEYNAYCQMLIQCYEMYIKAGNVESAKFCMDEILGAQAAVAANKDRLSPLGKLIDEQPRTVLSKEVRDFIKEHKGGAG